MPQHDTAKIAEAGHEYLNKVGTAGVSPGTIAILTKIIGFLPTVLTFIESFQRPPASNPPA